MPWGKKLVAALACGVALPLLLAEVSAQLYVDHVAQRGKLFTHDAALGWRVLPDLDLVRLNADGEPWKVRTDDRGYRGPSSWRPNARRVLVLGDSFAFGEGVDVEARFDAHFADSSVVNLGVMGYGTDQEIVAARPWLADLREGDALVLLTFVNDFLDLTRARHAGRAKPRFELHGGDVVEHAPAVGALEILRDRSYCAALLIQRLRPAPPEPDVEALLAGRDVYAELLRRELAPLAARGVEVVLAHHGDAVVELPFEPDPFYAAFAALGFDVVPLDETLGARGEAPCYLADGHWNAEGHARVGRRLAAVLAEGRADR